MSHPDTDEVITAAAETSSPPHSPTYPPLLSASLFPPPPPTYQHYTPLNLHFHSILTDHWPQKGSREDQHLYHLPDGDQHAQIPSSGWTPRLKLQRTLLLAHSSTLASLPHSVRSVHTELKSDEDVRQSIFSLGNIDLKLEMDPPDLQVLSSEAVAGYMAFGQWWPIPPKQTALEEAGVRRLYQQHARDEAGRIDRRPALLLLLRTFITTYLKLLSLLQYPPSYTSIRTLHSTTSDFSTSSTTASGQVPQQSQQEEITWSTSASLHWTHLRTLVINFQEVLNLARPEQARCNLQAEMRRRVDQRRRHLQRIREVIRDNRAQLGTLREIAAGGGGDSAGGETGSVVEDERGGRGETSDKRHPEDKARGPKRVKIRVDADDDDAVSRAGGVSESHAARKSDPSLSREDAKEREMIDVKMDMN